MAFHGCLRDESLAADRAYIWPLSGMGPFVYPQRSPLRKCFAAVLAYEGLLAGMHPHVFDELLFFRETLRTDLATVRFVPSMGAVVELKFFHTRQSLAADITQDGRVYTGFVMIFEVVSSQTRGRSVVFVAYGAVELNEGLPVSIS